MPSNSSVTWHPPFLHGVPRRGSPASSVLLRCYDTLSPSRRTSFPSFGGTAAAPVDLLPQGTVALFCGPGRLVTRSPAGIGPRRSQGSPRFLGGPPCVHALGCYPGGPPTPSQYSARDIAFRSFQDVGSPMQSLEADYHGLHTRCLRFVTRITPTTTQDSLPVGG